MSLLKINIRERLSVVVADGKARGLFLDGPGWRYGVGTRFKHPWVRNQTDKKPTTCIVTQIRDGVIYFRGYRSDRKLGSWTGELSETAFETHFVLTNVLRTEDQ